MKKRELEEHKGKTIAELQSKTLAKTKELVDVRMEHMSGKLRNVRKIKLIGRDIAQLTTLIRLKQIESAIVQEAAPKE